METDTDAMIARPIESQLEVVSSLSMKEKKSEVETKQTQLRTIIKHNQPLTTTTKESQFHDIQTKINELTQSIVAHQSFHKIWKVILTLCYDDDELEKLQVQ